MQGTILRIFLSCGGYVFRIDVANFFGFLPNPSGTGAHFSKIRVIWRIILVVNNVNHIRRSIRLWNGILPPAQLRRWIFVISGRYIYFLFEVFPQSCGKLQKKKIENLSYFVKNVFFSFFFQVTCQNVGVIKNAWVRRSEQRIWPAAAHSGEIR